MDGCRIYLHPRDRSTYDFIIGGNPDRAFSKARKQDSLRLLKSFDMKTLSKKSVEAVTSGKGPAGPRPKGRKHITDRDLNGEEGQVTNAPREEERVNDGNEDTSPPKLDSDTSVEDEQDREVKRRIEDAHPDEVLV